MLNNCLNCDQELLREAKHCSNCGQKVALQNLSVWSIVSDFFSNLFNIEAKIWRTFRDIWKPAMLTTAYISGKRVMYYNPIRIFIIALFTFFALYIFSINDTFKSIDKTFKLKEHEMWKANLHDKYDSLSLKYNWPEEISSQIKNKILTENSVDEEGDQKNINPDSLSQADNLLAEKQNIDTTNSGITEKKIVYESGDGLFTFDLADGETIDGITLNDFFRLSEEELKEKHKDKSWLKQVVIVQIQKALTNFSSMLQFFIGNGTWLMIVLILLTSAFSKLLYWRQNYLYAEHFIFHVYGHTRLLILAIFGLLFEIVLFKALPLDKQEIMPSNAWLMPWIIIGFLYLFLGMKKFYGQSYIKTTFKFILVLFVYSWLISFCLLAVLGLSFLFF
mgnify:CR=1 FL=1